MENQLFDVTYQPQVRADADTRSVMRDVLLALVPAICVGVWRFGVYTFWVILVSAASAVGFEWAYRKIMKKSNTIHDLSALVSGVLLALVLPPNVPLWLPIIGAFFAIVVVKQLYGGIGKNFLNPALAARAFLLASYPTLISQFPLPTTFGTDTISAATPLTTLYQGGDIGTYGLKALLTGNIPGCTGEISAIAIMLGGLYLIWRGVISWRIPTAYIGTVAVLSFIMGFENTSRLEWTVYNVLSGGLMLGAFFMATDYVTSPVTPGAMLVFGCGCGIITVLIHYYGGYPEGVSYAILLMNLVVWPLDKLFHRRPFGDEKGPNRLLGGKE
ncbi:MAG: RnfABCDGE type electron transport complex subunit D [Oscillospiraceae bacterium]|nr:RnfABCDGE type electron transport complex subunit D [Oscillospiraceae bacterium]